MPAAQSTSLDVDTLRRAIEQRDPDTLTRLFKDDAECVIIDSTNPPSSPDQRRGKQSIDEYNRFLLAPDKTHRLDRLVASGDTAAYAITCDYEDGTRVYCNAFADLADGKISRQVCLQAWDE